MRKKPKPRRKSQADRSNKLAVIPRAKQPRGRRLLIELFPEIRNRVVNAVKAGAPLALAVVNGKISEQTLFNYVNAGEEVARKIQAALEAGEKPPKLESNERAVLDFFEALREAQSNRFLVDMIDLTNAGKRDWKSIGFRLERLHRAEFGRPDPAVKVVTTPGGDGPQTVEFFWSDGKKDDAL